MLNYYLYFFTFYSNPQKGSIHFDLPFNALLICIETELLETHITNNR